MANEWSQELLNEINSAGQAFEEAALSGNPRIPDSVRQQVAENVLYRYYQQQKADREAKQGRTAHSYLRDTVAENVANPVEYSTEQLQAAKARAQELSEKLDNLKATKSRALTASPYAAAAYQNIASDEEISNTESALALAQKQQERMERDTARAKQAAQVRAVDEALERGVGYAAQYDAYSQSLKALNAEKQKLTQQLSDIRGGRAGYFGQENADAQEKAEKDTTDRIERLEREIERIEGQRNYASLNLGKDKNAAVIIKQGEELSKNLKEVWDNNDGVMASVMGERRVARFRDKSDRYHPTENWTPEQQAVYNYLLAAPNHGAKEAEEYAAQINDAINRGLNAAATAQDYAWGAQADGNFLQKAGATAALLPAGIAAAPSHALSWMEKISDVIQGNPYVKNAVPTLADRIGAATKGRAEQLNKDGGTISEAVPIVGGKGFGDLFQLGQSVVQSAVMGNLVGEGATLAAFFAQSADSAFDEAKARGGSDEYAAMFSTLSGLAEVLGEKISLDHMLKGGNIGSLKYILKQAGIEGAEEVNTTVLNQFFDRVSANITGDQTAIQSKINALVRQGMSYEDAERQVWKETVEDVAWDFTGGFISGGMSGVVQGGVQQTQNRNNRNQQTAQPAQPTQTTAARGPTTRNPLYEALRPQAAEPVAENATTNEPAQAPQNAAQAQEAPTGEITPPTAQSAQSTARASSSFEQVKESDRADLLSSLANTQNFDDYIQVLDNYVTQNLDRTNSFYRPGHINNEAYISAITGLSTSMDNLKRGSEMLRDDVRKYKNFERSGAYKEGGHIRGSKGARRVYLSYLADLKDDAIHSSYSPYLYLNLKTIIERSRSRATGDTIKAIKREIADLEHRTIPSKSKYIQALQGELTFLETRGASAQSTQPQTAETAQTRLEKAQARYAELERAFDNGEVSEEDAPRLAAEMEQRYNEIQELTPLAEQERQSAADAQTQRERVQNGEVSKGYGTPENHIDRRTSESVGNVGMKSFQFDNPQLHGYYVEAAQALFDEVQRAEDADLERAMKRESGSAITGPIRRLMDMGLTKPQIVKSLQDIIADNGQENYAAAKRVELVLNDMLTNGWQGQRGRNDWHEANADYIAAKDAISGGIKADSWGKYLADHELSLMTGEVTEDELRAEWERMHPQEEAATAEEPEAAPGPVQPADTASTGSEQSAGTIPASEQTTAERTNGQGPQRERGMSENLRNNEKAEPDLRNSFEQNRDLYTQLTNAEVAAKAAEIVGKGYEAARNDIYEKIGQAKAGAKLAPEYAVAGYQLANEMVRRGETEAARELCADIAAELTYAGQVGQIGRLILASDPSIRIRTVNRLVQKLNDGLSNRQKAKNVKKGVGTESGEIKVSDEALQRYAEAETDEAANDAMDAIEQEIADQIPATFRDKFTALRYLNMLGNLKTQGRNIVGNTAMMAATNAKYLTQHVIELARAAATGGEYQGNTALNTSKELRQQAAADFEAHMDEIQGDAKYADVGRQAAKGVREKQQIFGTTGNALWDNTIGRGLEGARKATNWAMEVGDEIFLRQVYVRSFAGWMKAHGVTDVNNASAEQVSAAREFAKKEAQEATFHDSNKVSDWVSSLGRGQNTPKVVKMISEGIVPFRKTPANVAVRAIEYSPVGVASTVYKAVQAKKGNADVSEVINSAAKNLTGSALFAVGMLLQAAGRARASGDEDDKELNAFEKMQGAMDYSVKIGDKYISLSQLAPMAIPFFMGVKLGELLEYSDDPLTEGGIGKILGVISDPMLEMSMLSGVNDFLNDLSSVNGDSDAVVSLVGHAAISYLTQGLTNTLLGQVEQAWEKNRQTTYTDTKSKAATTLDKFISALPGVDQYQVGKTTAKIPGLDYHQQDYVDAWGRTQSNGGVGERAFNAFLNPTYTGKDRSTDVDEELERLYRDNKGVEGFPDVFPQKRSRSDVIGDGVVMTPDEYLAFSQESGQKKLELVREFIQSSDYKGLTDEQRAETIHNLYAFADATALQKVRDANGVNAENKYAKIADLSNVPAYLAATERFKAEAAKEGKEFNGWTNTNFEKYVSAGLKAEDLDVLAESALSDARKPAYDLMREVGMSPKEYMDAIAVMDGEKHDGQFKQADVYSWLAKNTTMSTEQKNQLWDMLGNNWKTSFSNYKPK